MYISKKIGIILFILYIVIFLPQSLEARRIKAADYAALFPMEKLLQLGISNTTIEVSIIDEKTRVDLKGSYRGQYTTLMRLEFRFSSSLILEYPIGNNTERDKDERHDYIMSNLCSYNTSYIDSGNKRIYHGLQPLAILNYSAIEEPSLRGNGLGIDWYENYVEPYILDKGYNIICLWGSCFGVGKDLILHFKSTQNPKNILHTLNISPKQNLIIKCQLHQK
jgi:hypothetical protein